MTVLGKLTKKKLQGKAGAGKLVKVYDIYAVEAGACEDAALAADDDGGGGGGAAVSGGGGGWRTLGQRMRMRTADYLQILGICHIFLGILAFLVQIGGGSTPEMQVYGTITHFHRVTENYLTNTSYQ